MIASIFGRKVSLTPFHLPFHLLERWKGLPFLGVLMLCSVLFASGGCERSEQAFLVVEILPPEGGAIPSYRYSGQALAGDGPGAAGGQVTFEKIQQRESGLAAEGLKVYRPEARGRMPETLITLVVSEANANEMHVLTVDTEVPVVLRLRGDVRLCPAGEADRMTATSKLALAPGRYRYWMAYP